MAHANAPLTPEGRLRLCHRVESGRPIAHVAAEMGISRTTAYRWWKRYRSDGADGLVDRSSRPASCPHRTPVHIELEIVALRRTRKLGPARIGGMMGMHPSTVWRILTRYGLSRLRDLDPPTGQIIRRYERSRPGELIHLDIKKLGRIPQGGGWRAHGRGKDGYHSHSRVGYAYVHSAVDDHSRLAYSEVLPNEKGVTAAEFWQRAAAWFNQHGIPTQAVLTDNGPCYLSNVFAAALNTTGSQHLRTRPYRPQTNGKVERFNRTLLTEWAYADHYKSETQRTQALDPWLHHYNHHRTHTAIGNRPPISRVTNLPKQYS